MRNFTLLLVLASGLLAGYQIGDYRGKDARESLQKTVETGQKLDAEREATLSRLKTELGEINDKHHRELDAVRKDNESRMTAWRRTKEGLDHKIKLSTTKLAESDAQLKTLISQRNAAPEDEKSRLDLEIEHLRTDRENLRREVEGSSCLQARVPHSVFDVLNEKNTPGGKQ